MQVAVSIDLKKWNNYPLNLLDVLVIIKGCIVPLWHSFLFSPKYKVKYMQWRHAVKKAVFRNENKFVITYHKFNFTETSVKFPTFWYLYVVVNTEIYGSPSDVLY
jgi:hypothetical protein